MRGRCVGMAMLVAGAAGCVPLGDYRALERRFQEQEQYVVQHKDQVRELERREQVLTLRAREQERQLELTRTRLEKSETLRQRLETDLARAPEPAPAPAPAAPVPQPSLAGLEINPATNGLVLDGAVLFAPGAAELKAEGKRVLDRLLVELNGTYRGSQIRVDGHTDDVPIRHSAGKNSSNWELAARRALAVVHYLEEKGVDPNRLSFAGFGPFRPMDAQQTAQARQRNRRVEIVLMDG